MDRNFGFIGLLFALIGVIILVSFMGGMINAPQEIEELNYNDDFITMFEWSDGNIAFYEYENTTTWYLNIGDAVDVFDTITLIEFDNPILYKTVRGGVLYTGAYIYIDKMVIDNVNDTFDIYLNDVLINSDIPTLSDNYWYIPIAYDNVIFP